MTTTLAPDVAALRPARRPHLSAGVVSHRQDELWSGDLHLDPELRGAGRHRKPTAPSLGYCLWLVLAYALHLTTRWGPRGKAWRGTARQGTAGLGKAGQGKARQGEVQLDLVLGVVHAVVLVSAAVALVVVGWRSV